MRSVWRTRWRPRASSRPPAPRTPTWSSSTPATSARRRPRRSIPSSAACASLKDEAARNGRDMTHRGRGLRRAGRGRGDHPPRAGGRSRGRPAELSPAARTAGARRAATAARRHRISGRGQVRLPAAAEPARSARAASRRSSPCRKAATSSAPSASCPIRAAPKCRGRSRRSSPRSQRLADAGVREITLHRPERQRLSRRRPGRPDLAARPAAASARRSAGHRAAALHHQPSARHGRCLIAAHRDLPALMPYLHLPVQSGSDRILAAMNRRHTAADYLRVIERLRAARAGHRVVIGFHRRLPRRDRGRFRGDARAGHEVGYAGAYSFKYSPRPGTPAADMQETVPAAEMDERLRAAAGSDRPPAIGLQRGLRWQHLRCAVRTRRRAILARSSAASPYLQPVHVDGPPTRSARCCR